MFAYVDVCVHDACMMYMLTKILRCSVMQRIELDNMQRLSSPAINTLHGMPHNTYIRVPLLA